jgi:hypothetical protein
MLHADLWQGELNAQGQRHGRGVYTTKNGDVYTGEYVNGRRHGRGVYVRADGSRYEVRDSVPSFHTYFRERERERCV